MMLLSSIVFVSSQPFSVARNSTLPQQLYEYPRGMLGGGRQ